MEGFFGLLKNGPGRLPQHQREAPAELPGRVHVPLESGGTRPIFWAILDRAEKDQLAAA